MNDEAVKSGLSRFAVFLQKGTSIEYAGFLARRLSIFENTRLLGEGMGK